MRFTEFVSQISEINGAARLSVGRTPQQVLSLHNWLVGANIVEFEQAGEERATYGQVLMRTLADALLAADCQGLSWRNNFRQVALASPGLDPIGLGRQLGFPTLRILQTSAESGAEVTCPAFAGSAETSDNGSDPVVRPRKALLDQTMPRRSAKSS